MTWEERFIDQQLAIKNIVVIGGQLAEQGRFPQAEVKFEIALKEIEVLHAMLEAAIAAFGNGGEGPPPAPQAAGQHPPPPELLDALERFITAARRGMLHVETGVAWGEAPPWPTS